MKSSNTKQVTFFLGRRHKLEKGMTFYNYAGFKS